MRGLRVPEILTYPTFTAEIVGKQSLTIIKYLRPICSIAAINCGVSPASEKFDAWRHSQPFQMRSLY